MCACINFIRPLSPVQPEGNPGHIGSQSQYTAPTNPAAHDTPTSEASPALTQRCEQGAGNVR